MSSRGDLPPEDQRSLARTRLVEIGEAIAAAVEHLGPGAMTARSTRVLDAWGRCPPPGRTRLVAELVAAAETGARRVARQIRELSTTDVERQRATPLELVRTLGREPTAVLAAAGVPEVVRERFDERVAPEDRYALALQSLGDLAADDSAADDLGPLQLAWGLARARALGV